MQSNPDELKHRHEYLINQLGREAYENSPQFRGRRVDLLGGKLRLELSEVKNKISAVSIDTTNEEVVTLLQREGALVTRIAGGEVELERVETEIAGLENVERRQRESAWRESKAKEERIREANVRLAEIDAVLSGAKPFPIPPDVYRQGPMADLRAQSLVARRRAELEIERGQLMTRIAAEGELTAIAPIIA